MGSPPEEETPGSSQQHPEASTSHHTWKRMQSASNKADRYTLTCSARVRPAQPDNAQETTGCVVCLSQHPGNNT